MAKSPTRTTITVSHHRCQSERGFEMISQDFFCICSFLISCICSIFINHISKEGNVPHPALLTSKSHKASLREVSRQSGETFLTPQSMACICWFPTFLSTSSPYTNSLETWPNFETRILWWNFGTTRRMSCTLVMADTYEHLISIHTSRPLIQGSSFEFQVLESRRN